jgi:hypothetical protein
MADFELNFNIDDRTRLRAMVLQLWIQEAPGGAGKVSAFRYNVERLADGSKIYLARPARLNKGADFVVMCENFLFYKNGNAKPPRQRDLIDELGKLVKRSNAHSQEILGALREVWECRDINVVVGNLKLFKSDVSAERVLKLAKWLFIEQDVTYWSYSGRAMLRGGIEKAFGPFPKGRINPDGGCIRQNADTGLAGGIRLEI